MPYPAAVVANSLLQRGFREARVDLTPMKLQKLAYFLHGWMLATTGLPASNEPFHAWMYGPVIPDLYSKLKVYGSERITQYIPSFDPVSQQVKPLVVGPKDEAFQRALDLTWEKYIGISALSLSSMTHEANSPWEQARRIGDRALIPDAHIQDYFVKQVSSAAF